jgi:hypothetical protein
MGVQSEAETKLLKQLKDDEDIGELLPTTVSRKTKSMNYKPMLLVLGHLMDNDAAHNPVFKDCMT